MISSETILLPSLALESGATLVNVPIHYRTSGNLERSPIVWVFHALTANDDPTDWWPGLFGPGGHFDGFAWICVNVLGSPYGSASPLTHGRQDFPLVTVRDTVRAQLTVAQHLGIRSIHTAIGGSFGGYQAMEFAWTFEGTIDHLVLIAAAVVEKPWNKAIHEAQRLALAADPTLWQPGGGLAGLAAARAMGMINYRTAEQYNRTQSDLDVLRNFNAPSYIRHQAQKMTARFDAACYFRLTEQLDTHNLGRGRGGLRAACSKISTPTTVIGIDSDLLIPLDAVAECASLIPGTQFEIISSPHGHDGFLTETEAIGAILERGWGRAANRDGLQSSGMDGIAAKRELRT